MPPKFGFPPAFAAIAALGLALTPTAAQAAGFTPEGQQHWLSVAHALIDASNGTTEQMGTVCQGVSLMGGGSEIRHEFSQVPKWAVMAHFQVCIAFKSISSRERGKGFLQSTNPCNNIKVGIAELAKAKADVDPDEVVVVAGQLNAALTSLIGDFKDAKTCTFRTVGPLG